MKTEITPSNYAPRNEENSEGQSIPTKCEGNLDNLLVTEIEKIDIPYRTLIENAPYGIALLNTNGEFKFVNSSGCSMFGYSADEIMTIQPATLIHPDELESVVSHIRRVISEPSYTPTIQYRFATKEKQWIWIETTFHNVIQDPNVNSILLSFRDFTKEKQVEDALRRNEFLLEQALQLSSIGYWELNLGTNQLFWSEEIFSIFEIDPIQFEANYEAFLNAIHPDDRQMVDKAYIQSLDLKKPYRIEHRLLFPDNRIKYVLEQCQTSFDKAGLPTISVGTVQDITERKIAEEEKKEKAIQYFNLANSGLSLLWTSDINRLCNYFNNQWLEFTGRTLEQEVGTGWAEGVHPDDRERCRATSLTAFNKREAFEMEYRLHHASGEYRWILDMGIPNFNSNNEFIGYIGKCYDITERKKSEYLLQLSERKFRSVFENSIIAKSLTTVDGKLFANKSYCNIVGYTAQELSQMNWTDLTHPDDVENNKMIIISILKGEKTFSNWEKRYIHKDGHIVWINISTLLLRDSDEKPLHFITEIYDISARKKAEEALIKSEELFKKAFLTSPDSVTITRMSDGVYVQMSEGFSTLFGYSTDEVIGKSSLGIHLWCNLDDRDKWVKLLMQNETVKNFESRFITKNNGVIYVLISASIIELEGVKHIISVTRDITERKMAEIELQENMNNLQRFQQLTVGRELSMIELKKEVNELRIQTGKEAKYEIVK
jgi:PAS domain S-box-containing protein